MSLGEAAVVWGHGYAWLRLYLPNERSWGAWPLKSPVDHDRLSKVNTAYRPVIPDREALRSHPQASSLGRWVDCSLRVAPQQALPTSGLHISGRPQECEQVADDR